MSKNSDSHQRLTEIDEIDQLIQQSHDGPVLIFKHSLTCGISTAAFREYERYLADNADDGVDHRLIEIQHSRPVSTAVAERTGVRHESPQALLLHGGKVVWHASHSGIHVGSLGEAVSTVH